MWISKPGSEFIVGLTLLRPERVLGRAQVRGGETGGRYL
jgi:hypothetical protein